MATRFMSMLASAVLVAVTAESARGQDPTAATRQQMVSARAMLERGAFRDAEAIYSAAIAVLPPNERALVAGAYFGRAFAAQQRFVSGDTAGVPVRADSVVRDYRQAASLNPENLGAAAQNNIGLVLRASGRHAEAARAFRLAADAAASASASERATYEWQAGRELEAVGETEAARSAYAAALTADPTNAEVCAALLDLLARRYPADSAIGRAARWVSDTARAKLVNDGMIALLLRESPAVSEESAARALVVLASSWATVRVGPTYFTTMLAEPLRRIAARHSSLGDAVAALTDAYAPRSPARAYVEPPRARWWHRDPDRPDGAYAVWSTVLRSIGDTYNQRGTDVADLARSYYEAALSGDLTSPHIDRKAMLPLALIYIQTFNTDGAARLQDGTRRFTDRLFDAKGAAYRAGDYERIRDFHTTLGALYAAQGKWTGDGAQNAEFQLEGMRRATRELAARESKRLVDPPDLLEKLATHYEREGKTAQAAEVKVQLRDSYRRVGRPEAGDSAVQRIERIPRATPTVTDRARPAVSTPVPDSNTIKKPSLPAGATRTRPNVSTPAVKPGAPAVKPGTPTTKVTTPVTKPAARPSTTKPSTTKPAVGIRKTVPDSLKRDTTRKPM